MIKNKTAYLAGPMASLSYSAASAWRTQIEEGLQGICECLSPLRGEMLADGVYSATATDSSPFNTKQAIIGRDRNDCTKSDLIFMNLLGAKKVSIGTMTELGWADAARVPVIVVMEKSGNPHDSIYVRELATWLVHDLESGMSVARCFFNAPPPEMIMTGEWGANGKMKMEPWIPRRSF